MKLEDALKGRAPASPDVFFLNGELAEDSRSDWFRLYQRPGDHRSYFVIQRRDVAGDIYEWSDAEKAASNFFGIRMFRVPLRYGTELEAVEVTLVKVGETIAGQAHRIAPRMPGASGLCHYANGGCSPDYCCSEGTDGKCYCNNCCVAASPFPGPSNVIARR